MARQRLIPQSRARSSASHQTGGLPSLHAMVINRLNTNESHMKNQLLIMRLHAWQANCRSHGSIAWQSILCGVHKGVGIVQVSGSPVAVDECRDESPARGAELIQQDCRCHQIRFLGHILPAKQAKSPVQNCSCAEEHSLLLSGISNLGQALSHQVFSDNPEGMGACRACGFR